MPEVKNTFLKGRMNQDLDSRILPEGEYREAINLMISRSEGSTVGEFENVLGNTLISTISSNKNKSVIGHVIDQTNNLLYLFATTFSSADEFSRAGSSEECSIIQVNLNNPEPPTVLVDGYWLNFNKKFPIHAANILEDFIFWTDNFNQPRRICISTAVADPQAYTEEMQISVAKYYPFRPIIPMERTSAFTSVASAGSSTEIVLAQGNSNIRVGDFVTPNDKTNVANMPIRNVRPPVQVVEIIDPTAVGGPTTFRVSPEIITDPSQNPPTTGPVPYGTLLDFSRTSMQNRSEEYLSNYSIQEVNATGLTTTSFEVHADANDNISALFQGVPRVGDILTIVDPANNINNIPNSGATQQAAYQYDIRVTKVKMNMGNSGATLYEPKPNTRFMTIEVDKDMTASGNLTGLTAGDKVLIASNPNFERNFPGDTKFLDDKFVRFSYRFKFEDNEYSLMAPFSKIMFIPKQFGQFNLGQIDTDIPGRNTYGIHNYYQDEIDAYSSTIIEWFENNIDSIGLKIPLPATLTDLQTKFKVAKIDILYKESDALAVKVLETVNLSSPNLSTEIYQYNDDTHGVLDQQYFNYVYKSNKPYKTLPQNQTTRVYDKVPIKALGQEIISNRIVYGNFLERMTPPEAIDYSVSVTNTDIETSDYAIQYPTQTTKQNRIYQVGFVLADYYGRQSDVILSSNDSVNNVTGSTVTIPYRDANDAITEPVIDWMGSNLALSINEAIADQENNPAGKPGLYREEGWVRDVVITASTQGQATSYEENASYSTRYQSGQSGEGTGLTVRITEYSLSTGVVKLAIITAGSGYESGDLLELNGPGGVAEGKPCKIEVGKVGDANPLGWYTYKVVVKQQQQEYYNVYLPGFVNGLPINDRLWNKIPLNNTIPTAPGFTPIETERGKIFFSTILSDNINKIPRNLTEVGPTDEEFNSDEQLFIRVNNPNVFSLNTVTSYTAGPNYYIFAENQQYYPSGAVQNVLTMSTVKENQLAAVPFQKFRIAPVVASSNPVTEADQEFPQGGFTSGDQGEYGLTTRYIPSGTTQVITTERGSIPWGDVGSVASFYGADQNPFIMKVGQPGNFDNAIGSIVIDENEYGAEIHDTNFASSIFATAGGPPPLPITNTYIRTMSMRPKLTVAETKPVESLLEIFWETAMSGKLEVLNNMIETNYDGAIGVNNNFGSFEEDQGLNTAAGNQIKFINGSGSEISTLQDVEITAVYRSSAPNTAIFNPDGTLPFEINLVGAAPATEAQITTNALFWYGDNSYQNDVYIFDLLVTSGNNSEYVDPLPGVYTLTLANDEPEIFDDTGTLVATGSTVTTSNISVDSTDIYQFSGKNGSADTSNDTQQLSFSIVNYVQDGNPQTGTPPFSIDNTGKVTSNATMQNESVYLLTIELDDANDSANSLVDVKSTNCLLQFTAGTLYAPKAIGLGQQGGTGEYTIFATPAPTNPSTGNPFDANGGGFYGFVQGTTASTSSNFLDTNALPTAMSSVQSTVYNTFNIRTIYNNAQTPVTNCRADLFQGTIAISVNWVVYTQGGAGSQLSNNAKWVIQYRPLNYPNTQPSGGWTEINSMAGSPNTYSATAGGYGNPPAGSFNTTMAPGTTYTETYKFDQLGQYRVVMYNLQNVNSNPQGHAAFHVSFLDGTYGQQLMTLGPCTP